jgi:ribosomal-protein-alanine N-acetyltransferase
LEADNGNVRAAAQNSEFSIRKARPEDAAQIQAIAKASPTAAQWPEGSYGELFKPPYLSTVIERQGAIAGFLVARIVAAEGEILNLAIKPTSRRGGLGRLLLHAGEDAIGAAGASDVFLEVRESNAAAIRFYERCGFSPGGRRRRYYRNPDEDAVLMRKRITSQTG